MKVKIAMLALLTATLAHNASAKTLVYCAEGLSLIHI